MILKKTLFIKIIFLGILILNIPFVFSFNYKIDINQDGSPDLLTGEKPGIAWRFGFQSYGREQGANLPTLAITGDDSFSKTIPAIEYDHPTVPVSYHAGWGCIAGRNIYSGSALMDVYYLFQHYASTTEYTETRRLVAGDYNLNLIAYGDALNPSKIEPSSSSWSDWEGILCPTPITNPVDCYDVCPPGAGFYRYFESKMAPGYANNCNSLGTTICPVCDDSINSCSEFDANNGYLCNGMNVIIEFYEWSEASGTGAYIGSLLADSSWANPAENEASYDKLGYIYLTDTTPSEININIPISVVEGCSDVSECPIDNICYEPACILNACEETLVPIGGNDEACISPNSCDGAGNCVECNFAVDCGMDGRINSFKCLDTTQIQQKYRDYSCISNTCSYADSWQNDGTCIFPNVCYGPTGLNDCCSPYCGPSEECGGDDCGGSCGDCDTLYPGQGTICSADQMCESMGDAYWADMNGLKIGEAGSRIHSEIDDTVLLIYKNHGADVGLYYFVISEDDGIFDDEVRTIPASQTFEYKGHLAAKWIINSSEFDKESDFGKADFYFMIDTEQSNNLEVNDSINNPSPDFPGVIIKQPIINSKVRVGNVLEFNQTANDGDDDLRIKWAFEDGDESDWMFDCLTTNNCNTTYTYDTSGTKIIEIIAREMTRTNEAVNYSQVFAYDEGINVFAVINSPPFGRIYAGDSARLVPFNASTSFIANCTTEGCVGCTYYVKDLHCYDLGKTVVEIPFQYNLFFDWTFSEGTGIFGNWHGDYLDIVEFDRLFYAPTAHWAKLIVDYISV